MELIIHILMLFIISNCILKLSFWKLWQTILFGFVCGVFILFVYPYAIQQSKTQIADYLQNTKILQDAAVLITLESAICFAFCFVALQNLFGKKRKRWLQPLFGYAGLLIFPVLFYLLTESIFAMSGVDFATIAYTLAIAVIVLFPLLSRLLKYLLPEQELRLEVHFLVSLFVCILGLLTTVNANVAYTVVEEPVNAKALGLSIGLFALTFIIGYVWNKIKWNLRSKKSNRKSK